MHPQTIADANVITADVNANNVQVSGRMSTPKCCDRSLISPHVFDAVIREHATVTCDRDSQDIEAKDQDATQTSELVRPARPSPFTPLPSSCLPDLQIQSTAEALDTKLQGAISKLENVGITKKALAAAAKKAKKAVLGEAHFQMPESGDYQQQLQEVEQEAKSMVASAESAEASAEQKKQASLSLCMLICGHVPCCRSCECVTSVSSYSSLSRLPTASSHSRLTWPRPAWPSSGRPRLSSTAT